MLLFPFGNFAIASRQMLEMNLVFQAQGLSGWEHTTPPPLPPKDDQGGHHHQDDHGSDHQDDYGCDHQDGHMFAYKQCKYFLTSPPKISPTVAFGSSSYFFSFGGSSRLPPCSYFVLALQCTEFDHQKEAGRRERS